MEDLTIRHIISLADSASLIPDLAIMVRLDSVMMDLDFEVIIKHHIGGVGCNFSIVRAEGEGEFGTKY